MSKASHTIEPEELMAYLDGELRPDEAARAAAHLEHCRECQKLAADLQQISQEMLAWEVEESCSKLVCPTVDSAEKQNPVAKMLDRWSWLSARKLAPAAALLVIAIVYLAVSLNESSLRGPDQSSLRQEDRKPQSLSPAKKRTGTGTEFVNGQLAAQIEDGRPGSGDYADSYNGSAAGKLTAVPKIELPQKSEPVPSSPMIAKTAELSLIAGNFADARRTVDAILSRHAGYIGQLTLNTPQSAGRQLNATLQIPSNQLDAAMAELKALGRVEMEAQSGEEVTQQYVDLEARLDNARNTERRLTEMLSQRTGKLSDVLAVEKEIDSTRGEIEQMEAAHKALRNRVEYASLDLTISEDYKEHLEAVPDSTGTRFRNAAVSGYRSMVNGMLGVSLRLLEVLPTVLLWSAILFFPARFAWKKLRNRSAA